MDIVSINTFWNTKRSHKCVRMKMLQTKTEGKLEGLKSFMFFFYQNI